MKSLRISELLLWSDRELAARRIPFHPETTVVLGKNDTGKSSILKSLYWTFGAEPAVVHKDWRDADVSSLVRFTVDGTNYSILRKGSLYAIFGADDQLLHSFQRVTAGLGPFLAKLFDFGLKLKSQHNEIITPPPAYFFLPFYIDQDAGWKQNWSSFARLQQIPKWRHPVVEYHTGLKPNAYYEARAALQVTEEDLRRQSEETTILKDVRDRMQQQTHTASFDVSLEDFRDQLDELLKRCGALLKIEEELKASMQELTSERLASENQRRIVEATRKEVAADYAFATKKLVHESVDCPTCGAVYDNSFADRFMIARDEGRLVDLLFEIDEEIRGIDSRLERQREAFNDNRAEVVAVSELLEATRSEISLAMVLQSEGRKEVDAIFVQQLDEAFRRRAELEERVSELRLRLKGFEDRERREEILGVYRQAMSRNAYTLNCSRLGDTPLKRIDSKINESGSDQPRALLAYFYSVLQVMAKYSTSTFCPIVIDSPNQQAQDTKNLPGMLRFIRDNKPENSQLILALEEMYEVDFPGETILLERKDRLLFMEQYSEVREEMAPFLDRALGPQEVRARSLFDDE